MRDVNVDTETLVPGRTTSPRARFTERQQRQVDAHEARELERFETLMGLLNQRAEVER